ncbi:hypothetical protein C0J45_19172 [Silurus meridionalis]|nr:hypothetical protein C0J45_19172 [Silurus meridionalis]
MIEDKARAKLMQQMDLGAYKAFNETVLAQVIFNKRREGEASHLTLDIYKKASTISINQDIYTTLSPLGKELSKILTHLEMRGNGGKKVPVFLTERMKESIDLLVHKREEAGVPAENPYLFARPGVMTNIRGCDCLRKYVEEIKTENPELLLSTNLRKLVTTLCQLLDFTEQTDKTFQIAMISKLLFAMEQSTETLRGKNLTMLRPSVCDGCSDLFFSQRAPAQCSEDGVSDDEDHRQSATQAKRPSPKKKKREE